MTLHLLPLAIEDFDIMISHATTYPVGDDLVAPPLPLCWPVDNPSSALARLTFSMTNQRQRFLLDPSVRFMKVVDDVDGSIVSVARWHYYPSGYCYERDVHWELISSQGEGMPAGMNVLLHNHILSARDAARVGWQGAIGSPCWVLMHMVTRPSQRGRGAAGLLIQWGVQQAEGGGVPAYLEAGVMGQPIYERHGFRAVGELIRVDLGGVGGKGEFVMATMGYFPKERGGGESGG